MSFMKNKPTWRNSDISSLFLKIQNNGHQEWWTAITIANELLYPFHFDDTELCGTVINSVNFGTDSEWLNEVDVKRMLHYMILAVYELITNQSIDRDNFSVYFLFEKVKEAVESRDCAELDEYVGLLLESLLKRI